MSNTQVELKKVVYALSQGRDKLTCSFEPTGYSKYVRFDLVDRLRPHLRHLPDCNTFRQDWNGGVPGPCTCGLTELLGEMGNG